ncbi:hypothetical protein A4S05_37495 [Nostoc sp. KVJ20]|nr:hypothetical protein A4S05_37495 [Nostoc sp. KVJ20]
MGFFIEDVGGRGQDSAALASPRASAGGKLPDAPEGLGFKTRTPKILVLWLFFRRGLNPQLR